MVNKETELGRKDYLYSVGQMTLAASVMYLCTFFFVVVLALPLIDQGIEKIMVPTLLNSSTGQVSPMADITIMFARFIPIIFITAVLVSAIKTAVPQFESDRQYR
jgi:hypothetical protein